MPAFAGSYLPGTNDLDTRPPAGPFDAASDPLHRRRPGACRQRRRLLLVALRHRGLERPGPAGPAGRPPLPPEEPDLGPGLSSGPVTSAPLAPPPGAAGAPVVANPSGPIMAEPSPAAAGAAAGRDRTAARPSCGLDRRPLGGGRRLDRQGRDRRELQGEPRQHPGARPLQGLVRGLRQQGPRQGHRLDYRDGEVYLYQPGGTVAARLRPAGGAMDGALSKSGAPLAMVR